jgi:hypothetical protein
MQAIAVTHVAQEKAEARIVELNAHFMLLQLIAAEHDDPPWLVAAEGNLDELPAEGSSPASYKDGLVVKNHERSL